MASSWWVVVKGYREFMTRSTWLYRCVVHILYVSSRLFDVRDSTSHVQESSAHAVSVVCNEIYFRRPASSSKLAMFPNLWRQCTRLMSTAAGYPFSKSVLTPPAPAIQNAKALKAGRGLMEHIRQTLPTPEKQKMIHALFSRRSPNCLQPGSVVTVTLEHAPTTFTGVLLAVRRRGPDTSFIVRNIIQRTGVEMQFYVASPHLKDIKLVKKPPKGRMRRAKLYYLRDSPEKMSAIAGSR